MPLQFPSETMHYKFSFLSEVECRIVHQMEWSLVIGFQIIYVRNFLWQNVSRRYGRMALDYPGPTLTQCFLANTFAVSEHSPFFLPLLVQMLPTYDRPRVSTALFSS
jgi:hypothetical protein